MNTKTVIVIEKRNDAERPFQLCVGIYGYDTRLQYDDYPLTLAEWLSLRNSVLNVNSECKPDEQNR